MIYVKSHSDYNCLKYQFSRLLRIYIISASKQRELAEFANQYLLCVTHSYITCNEMLPAFSSLGVP